MADIRWFTEVVDGAPKTVDIWHWLYPPGPGDARYPLDVVVRWTGDLGIDYPPWQTILEQKLPWGRFTYNTVGNKHLTATITGDSVEFNDEVLDDWIEANEPPDPPAEPPPPDLRRRVALTFDDGPDPRNTPRLLDALEERDIRATFFVVGRQV